jgi:hypothetical protein
LRLPADLLRPLLRAAASSSRSLALTLLPSLGQPWVSLGVQCLKGVAMPCQLVWTNSMW